MRADGTTGAAVTADQPETPTAGQDVPRDATVAVVRSPRRVVGAAAAASRPQPSQPADEAEWPMIDDACATADALQLAEGIMDRLGLNGRR